MNRAATVRGCRNTWNRKCVPKVMNGVLFITFDSSLKTLRFLKYSDSLVRERFPFNR